MIAHFLFALDILRSQILPNLDQTFIRNQKLISQKSIIHFTWDVVHNANASECRHF